MLFGLFLTPPLLVCQALTYMVMLPAALSCYLVLFGDHTYFCKYQWLRRQRACFYWRVTGAALASC